MAKNDLCLIFEVGTKNVKVENVIDVGAEDIEVKDGIYRLADADHYVDSTNSRSVYVLNVDIPAKVEATNLKLLRRNTVLKSLFKYERNNKFDFMSLLPYIIIALLILFK